MPLQKRFVLFVVFVLLASSAFGLNLPNVDAFGAGKKIPGADQALAAKAGDLARPECGCRSRIASVCRPSCG